MYAEGQLAFVELQFLDYISGRESFFVRFSDYVRFVVLIGLPEDHAHLVIGEILSVEWSHRHYLQDDEYIPHGEDIEAFLKREIAKPIIRWEDNPQLGYEILPNKYFYKYQPPTPAKELLAQFWKLEKEAEKMLEGLAQ